jgi:tRNA threonylcarbamoyl adenosine modification protein YeaZ
MYTLAIDTSNQTLAVAVTTESSTLAQLQLNVKKNHSLTLMPAIDEVVSACGLTPKALDQIVVAKGPGSYTGLRIGVTTAKTLAYSLKIPLKGVSSLATVAANCIGVSGLIIPLFDARRQNVYAGAYRFEAGKLVNVLPDQHIALTALLAKLPAEALYFVGSDVEKFAETIKELRPEAQLNKVMQWDLPSGVTLSQLAQSSPVVEDVQGFLPDYLKRVEAEEKWLETHTPEDENYVEKI